MQKSYKFDEVAIIQEKCICQSRSDVKIESEITKGITRPIPLIAANMASVTNAQFCFKLYQLGALGILHRAIGEEEYLKEVKTLASNCPVVAASIGNNDHDLLAKLIKAGANLVVIDVAHAYCDATIDMCKHIRKIYPHIQIMVGNTININMLDKIDRWADGLKIGCASGCFAAGTRILMSNGTYKNIEDIKSNDKVINMDGKAVSVKRVWCSGVKKVSRYKNNSFYKNTICTPDHRHWIGDLSSTSQKTINARGFKKLLDQLSKTIPKKSKYKWSSIDDLDQGVLLFPRKINFVMPETFRIELQKRCGGNWRTGYKYKIDHILKPSYELGYIFGTFLGDGNARCFYNKKRRSNTGQVNWSFGKNEIEICNKLDICLFKMFKKYCVISDHKNMLKCHFYYKPLADFLFKFGKRQKKHLPENLCINNKKYLKGIIDGLIDSDGNIYKGRKRLSNTSPYLIELFNISQFIVNGSLPINGRPQKCTSALIKNPREAFVATCLIKPEYRLTKKYQIIKLLDYRRLRKPVKVYDLEINCPTHSFIANNVIVHNSTAKQQ